MTGHERIDIQPIQGFLTPQVMFQLSGQVQTFDLVTPAGVSAFNDKPWLLVQNGCILRWEQGST